MGRHPLPVQLGQPPFEIVVDQGDREVRRPLDDANAEFAQGGAEFGGALHVDRFNQHATVPQILFGDSRRQAEARPVAGQRAQRRARARHT